MADGSEGERKQAEPEGKTPSQVRLEWKEDATEEEPTFCALMNCASLIVGLICSDRIWQGSVIAPGSHSSATFDTKEEAQLWCEAKLTELLQKDLKSLGGGVQAEPAAVTP